MSNAHILRRCQLPAAIIGLSLSATAAGSVTLEFPGSAVQTATQSESLASYELPVGPWSSGTIPSKAFEGRFLNTAWRVEMPGETTLELLVPLREQLLSRGFAILWECETQSCGGFDFRYAVPVIAEPDMHVDLGDFRFLSAVRGTDQAIAVLVSRSAGAGYVQVTSLGGDVEVPVSEDESSPPPSGSEPLKADSALPVGFRQKLEATGSVALDDLTFETGSATLGTGDFGSLSALADYLRAYPDRTVVLVGHTDASGGLAGNIALSKARATSVRDRLISSFAIPAKQVSAEGAGYLAPRDTNLTESGRARNRRVEVMLTSTQ